MKRLFYTLLALIAITLAPACSNDDDDNTTEPAIPIVLTGSLASNPQISVDATTSIAQISFFAAESWEITVDDASQVDWLSLDYYSGESGNKVLNVSFVENTDDEARTAELIISSTSDFSVEVTIEQAGADGVDDDTEYEGVIYKLSSIPTDGLTITDDIWVITDSGNPTYDQFANLQSALNSVGEERKITLYLPNMTSIPSYTFENCTSLVSVSTPEATSIGGIAFRGCTALAEVSLPEATSIGSYAFYGCTSLTSISLPMASSIGSVAFSGCTSLEEAYLPVATSIESSSFYSCSSLTSVSAPVATSVGSFAFYDCPLLISVSFPEATSIGNYAFYINTSLVSADLPKVTTLGGRAFLECSALASVSLPAVTSVGYYAFRYCTALTSLVLATESTSLTVSSYAFSYVTLSELELTVGANNGSTVSGNYWTVTDTTFGEFKSIIVVE